MDRDQDAAVGFVGADDQVLDDLQGQGDGGLPPAGPGAAAWDAGTCAAALGERLQHAPLR